MVKVLLLKQLFEGQQIVSALTLVVQHQNQTQMPTREVSKQTVGF
jgi:hypothetical protein